MGDEAPRTGSHDRQAARRVLIRSVMPLMVRSSAELNAERLFLTTLPRGTARSTILGVATVTKIVEAMRANPQGINFNDLAKVCEHYFGSPRQTSGSHMVFRTPWPGDPRVNIQNDKGKAKAYQVRQVLKAIEKKEAM